MSNTEKPRKAFLTRRVAFSAAHRLHSKQLSNSQNIDIYGKCNNPKGHGHNYVVEVTVYGPVDPITGMVVNLEDVKQWIEEAIMKKLDHKNLDEDVPHFSDRPSTTENVTIFIWDSIKSIMSKPELLYEIKVFETEKNIITYRG